MKFRRLIPALAALLAGAFPPTPSATATLVYNEGDLLAAFSTNGTIPHTGNTYLFDLGSVAQFLPGGADATGSLVTLAITGASVLTDLSTAGISTASGTFSLQAEDSNNVIANDNFANKMWLSKPETTPGTASSPFPTFSNGALATPTADLANLGTTINQDHPPAAASNPHAIIQSTTDPANNTYGQYVFGSNSPTNAYETFSNPEGAFTKVLDLYEIRNNSTSLLGAFDFNASTGIMRFDSNIAGFAPAGANATVVLDHSSYAITEGASPSVAFTITRSGNLTKAFTVNFSTGDGTAKAGTDYTTTAQAVSFAANDTTKTVSVPVASIPGFQGDRSFNVGLALSGSPAGVVLGAPNTASVTIHDSSPNTAGQIAFSAATYAFAAVNNQAQPNDLTITLNRTSGTTGSVSVEVTASGGSKLVNGTDYTFSNPTVVTFGDGVSTQTFDIQLKPIAASKLPGTINLTLASPTGNAALGTQATATVTVNPPDKTAPTVTVTAVKAPTTQPPNNTITVAGTAGDNQGIDRVEVRVNGGPAQIATLGSFGTPTKGKATFSLANVALANGKNTIMIQAFDLSGNKSAVSTLSLTYVNSRPQFAGYYNGLLVPAETPSDSNSGLVTLTVTSSGAFTGKVSLDGLALAISGIFGNDGVAHFNPTLATTIALKATPTATSLGDLALSITSDATTDSKVIGTLTAGALAANLDAPRAFFDGKTPATSVDPKFLMHKGLYTVIFPAKDQAGNPDKSTYPQGDGIGTITVTKAGSVSLAGTLADGTPVLAKGSLSKDYRVPLFEALYKTGSIAGVVKLDVDTQADSDLKGLDFLWIRPAIATAKYYPLGWPGGIKVDLLGAEYTVPTVATPPMSVFPGLNTAIAPGAANATLKFSDGLLMPAGTTITKSVHIAGTNAVTNVPLTDKTYTLALSPATGGISGSFTHTDGKKVAYKGIIFQKGPTKGAYGFFLSTPPVTKPPAAPGIGESGGVSLIAN